MPSSESLSVVQALIDDAVRVQQSLLEKEAIICAIAEKTAAALARGKKVLLCGNGGSAADAQHIAAELTGRFKLDRPPLPAVALTANTSTLTALANDFGYEEVFSRQVRALAAEGDVLIGISTSGDSLNVLLAMQEAGRKGALTVAFCGRAGKIRHTADLCLDVPSEDTPRIQEAHITAGHIICHLIEQQLFGGWGA